MDVLYKTDWIESKKKSSLGSEQVRNDDRNHVSLAGLTDHRFSIKVPKCLIFGCFYSIFLLKDPTSSKYPDFQLQESKEVQLSITCIQEKAQLDVLLM